MVNGDRSPAYTGSGSVPSRWDPRTRTEGDRSVTRTVTDGDRSRRFTCRTCPPSIREALTCRRVTDGDRSTENSHKERVTEGDRWFVPFSRARMGNEARKRLDRSPEAGTA